LNWNWNPNDWKSSTKILLGLATVWPVIYMGLFFISIFSFIAFLPFEEARSSQSCGNIDLIQLERKIKNGELKELTATSTEIVARDRVGYCSYETSVTNDSTRQQILREAREVGTNGSPRVAKVDENTSRPASSPMFPIGVVALFAVHTLTIFLIMGLMPLYIILAVKSDRLDQTTRIVWVVLLCMMGMFAMPVYWYLYIWRKPPIGPSGGVAQPIGDRTSGAL
jgi:hypothetical protein